MKWFILLFTALLVSCGSDESNNSVETTTVLVIGDSLCVIGWPTLLDTYEVTNKCVSGQTLVGLGDSFTYTHVNSGYYDHTIISIGVNDAARGISPEVFELAYLSLYDTVYNPICVLPPLSDWPHIQTGVSEYHRVIQDICEVVVESYPSDHPDGLHYTVATDNIMADRIKGYLTE